MQIKIKSLIPKRIKNYTAYKRLLLHSYENWKVKTFYLRLCSRLCNSGFPIVFVYLYNFNCYFYYLLIVEKFHIDNSILCFAKAHNLSNTKISLNCIATKTQNRFQWFEAEIVQLILFSLLLCPIKVCGFYFLILFISIVIILWKINYFFQFYLDIAL